MKPCVHRLAIAQLAANGEKTSRIASRLKVPLRTVQRIVKQWKSVGNVDVKKKSGRPPSVNTRRIRALIKKRITRNDAVSLNSIAKSLDISRQSVQNIVKNSLGLRSYRLYRGQHLTNDAKLKRLTRCKRLLQIFRVRRVEDVLWSDEKIFTIEKAHNRQNDRQLLSPTQRNARKRKVVTRSLFPKGVMVWAGVTATEKTPLIFIDKNVKINAKTYQDEVLAKVVAPWKRKNANGIFQQDWAPAHGARTTLAFLNAHVPGYLSKDEWPSNSPDLNPLDFSVWGCLEEKLKSKNITSLDCLRRELTKAWDDLDQGYLRRTVISVIPRLEACVRANGGHFEQFV